MRNREKGINIYIAHEPTGDISSVLNPLKYALFCIDPYICLFKVKQTVLPPWNIYVMIYNTYNDAIYHYPLILS